MEAVVTRPASTRGGSLALAAAFALPAAALVLLRIPSLFEPRWYTDEGIFAAVAHDLLRGHMLYSEAWDNKPPLIFVTYATVQALFGTGVLPLHAAALAASLATLAALLALAAHLFGPRRAALAGLLFALLVGTPVIEGNLAMTETFMVVPTTLAVLVFVRAQARPEAARTAAYLACGALLGLAAGYKQVAVCDLLAVLVMVSLTHARPWRASGVLLVAFAAPQALFAAVFLAAGAFGAYWYAVAGSLGLYAGLAREGPAARLTGWLPALLVAAWLVRRRMSGEEVPLTAFPSLWLTFTIAGAAAGAFPFPHYLQQAAPAAALAAVSLPFAWERDAPARALVAATAVLVAALVFGQFAVAFRERQQLDPIAYYHAFFDGDFRTLSDPNDEYFFDGSAVTVRDVVRQIHADGGGRTLYTWSELPWLYATGGYTNPTRYYTSFLGEVVPDARPEIMHDLARRPPDYILISDATYAPFPELDRFVDERYTLVRWQNDWRLYRRAS
jgi:4-amino-4-deoxy-L-arabinose transferase-like glycosyltransferase